LPAASAGASFPRRHQDREIPGDDLADDAERLVIVIGDGFGIDLRDAALLRPHHAGEIAPVVDDQRHVRIGGLADRLAVVERLDQRQQVQIGFQLVGDLVEDARALSDRGLAPGVLRLVGGVEGEFDVGGAGARNRAELLAGDGAWIIEVASLRGRHPFAADEIVVAVSDENLF
jgi:ParB family chromosome partitioning protein